MSGSMGILDRILRAGEGKKLKALAGLVPDINVFEPQLTALSDEALQAKTTEFRQRLANGEDLDDLLLEAFAVTREASRRVIGQRHYDVQMMGGAALHFGWVAEMKTGEGKTLVSTLPAYLNGLSGKGVHLITVNDYLARRDAEWMGRIHRWMGLTVGLVIPDVDDAVAKRAAYACDITNGTNNEFGFDYLRDNMATRPEEKVQRGHNFAIVDEVDSILIDEARTPLIISGRLADAAKLYYKFAAIVRRLQRDTDYEVDEEKRTIAPTEEGIDGVEKELGVENLYDEVSQDLVHQLSVAIKAKELYKRDKDYIVQHGEVKIVDEFTGRILEGRRWSEGIHQAVEAKEGVKIKEENQTLATITLQNYFRMYDKLAGMTGTASTEAAELMSTYGLNVVPIPTNRNMVRLDQPDLIYKTEQAKFDAVVDDLAERYETGQPVLVGTVSVEKSEFLSKQLQRRGIPHEVLNAKQHTREAPIVAQAGRLHSVTVATNMAGRGVDIVLGGNPEGLAQREVLGEGLDLASEEGQARYQQLVDKYGQECTAEGDEVRALGGLYVLATERHESRRIDNQLRGRSGRQGDPGSSRFYLSLDDSLMRIFAGDRVRAIMERLKMPDGEAIEAGIVTRSIEGAQRKVEARNFDVRKQLLEYDDVSNDQRKVIYQQRNDILEADSLAAQITNLRLSTMTDVARTYVPAESVEEQWDLPALEKVLRDEWQVELALKAEVEGSESITDEEIVDKVVKAADAAFEVKIQRVGLEQFTPFMRMILLQSIDSHWREHLAALDYLRQGIHLRGYAQKNPKQEYKREAFELFSQLLDVVKMDVTRVLMTVRIQSEEEANAAAAALESQAEHFSNVTYTHPNDDGSVSQEGEGGAAAALALPLPLPDAAVPKVGRNEPCPCGSGKKYKNCHGRLA